MDVQIPTDRLVVEPPTPLKNHGLKVSWDDDIPFPTVSGKSWSIPWFQYVPVTTNQWLMLDHVHAAWILFLLSHLKVCTLFTSLDFHQSPHVNICQPIIFVRKNSKMAQFGMSSFSLWKKNRRGYGSQGKSSCWRSKSSINGPFPIANTHRIHVCYIW